MTLKDFFHLLRCNWLLLLAVPLVTASSIFFFTRKEVKEYASDTTIYTGIASTFTINENNEGNAYANNKAYGNLLSLIYSRATKQEVAIRLLARHLMLTKYDSTVLNSETYQHLNDLVPVALRQKLVAPSLEETINNLTVYAQSSQDNVISKVLASDSPSYSLEALSKIAAFQVDASDLIKIEYVSNDAAVCQQTLEELTQIFIRKHKQLQEGQNESVVSYFGVAAAKARQRLDAAEKSLLAFQNTNGIINYDAQAGNTATQREAFTQQANELELQYAGASSALRTLENSLKDQGISNLSSQEAYQLSNQLTKLRTQIANAEVFDNGKGDINSTAGTQKLQKQADQIERQLQEKINQYSAQNQSKPGVSSASLVEDWIKNSILTEELKAKLLVMRKQRDGFGKEYQKVAPLGAEMRKLERERVLAENEYLAVLNNLDQSKVTQQGIELGSRMKVVDPPYLGPNRAKSKRLLLVLFGAIGAMFMTAGGISAVSLLDQSLKTPAFASLKTKLPVFGVLPEKTTSDQQIALFRKAEDQLARQLLLKMQQKKAAHEPYIIGVMSSHAAAGKTMLTSSVSARLNALGIKSAVFLPESHLLQPSLDNTTAFYSPLQGLMPSIMLNDLLGMNSVSSAVVFIEFPALLEKAYPSAVLPQLDLVLVAVNANKPWEAADKNIFESISKITKAPIEVVLNRAQVSVTEDYIGMRVIGTTEEPEVSLSSPETQWQAQTAFYS